MANKYPTMPKRRGAQGSARAVRGPEYGFLPPAAPLPPPPPAVALPGAAGGGLGGAVLRGGIGGFARGRTWPWVLGGAVLGGIGYYVSQWNYSPNLMWMPAGFSKRTWNECWNQGIIRWNQSDAAPSSTPGAYCSNPPSLQFLSGIPVGTGFVSTTTRTLILYAPLGANMATDQVWERQIVPGPSGLAGPSVPSAFPFEWEFPDPDDPHSWPPYKPVPVKKPNPLRPGARPRRRPWPSAPNGPFPVPQVQPDPNPVELPVGNPYPPITVTPEVPPYVVPDVVIQPGPGTGPDTGPGAGPTPGTGPGTGPSTGPGTGTPPTTRPRPSTGVEVTTAPPSYRDTPAKRGEKERKVQTRLVTGAKHYVNIATEALDLVDVLYAGVPRDKRVCAPHDYACKLNAIYGVWDDRRYDPARAIAKFLNNEAQDFLIGQVGRRLGKANRVIGRLDQFGFSHTLRENTGAVTDPLPYLGVSEDGTHLEFKWGDFWA